MARRRSGPLEKLALRHGVLPAYVDATGVRRRVPAGSLVRVLRALGVEVPSVVGGRPSGRRVGPRPRRPASTPLVVSVNGTGPRTLALPHSLGRGVRPRSASLRVEGRPRWEGVRVRRNGSLVFRRPLPFGVHRLRLVLRSTERELPLVVAPRRLERSPGPARWGLFAPVYALRDRSTWGCGDFTALESMGSWAARLGASVVTTLPLLPAFLARARDASPYRPVSRRFWNEVYLDPSRTPEFRRSRRLREYVRSSRFRRRVARLERLPHVDFPAVARLKREVVERMLDEFAVAPVSRRRAFRRFVRRTEGLEEYSRFRAAREADPARAETYHRFVQWLSDEQLRGVAARLRRRGVALGLDLPVGVHPDGFDARRDRALFVPGIRMGSPPDPGVPAGQEWGFAPWHPGRLRRAGYRPFADALRHQLSVAGLLRIDHVLGLHRQFWVPAGRAPREGVYVRFPSYELYAVVRAEAARASARIVGEDLGTVPPEVRPALARNGLLAVYVAQLEWEARGRPRRIPKGCVASLNTHDQLPFAGYWARRVSGTRRGARQRRRRFGGVLPGEGAASAFREASLRLARSPAEVVLVNLEDLWGEELPQNEPGRAGGQFTRRCRVSLSELRRDARVAELLSTVDALRKGRYVR